MRILYEVARRKRNGVYHSAAGVPTKDGLVVVHAEGRSEIAARMAAVGAAIAVVGADLSRGRLSWDEMKQITFAPTGQSLPTSLIGTTP